MNRKLILLVIREIIYRLTPKIKVKSTECTLKKITDEKLSVSRFGDGEFSYILGEKIGHQKQDNSLCMHLKEILKEGSNRSCLVCIPFASYSFKEFNHRSRRFWFSYYAYRRQEIERYLNPKAEYYDSQITRIYINRRDKSGKYFSMWKELWKGKKILIVEGDKTRFGCNNDLFADVQSISRIICPAESAYTYYNEILLKTMAEANNYDLVLIALGITATLLAWQLSKEGIWAIDIGNMDNEYEWYGMRACKQKAIKGKYVYEAEGGRNVEKILDASYSEQIISYIGVDESR